MGSLKMQHFLRKELEEKNKRERERAINCAKEMSRERKRENACVFARREV